MKRLAFFAVTPLMAIAQVSAETETAQEKIIPFDMQFKNEKSASDAPVVPEPTALDTEETLDIDQLILEAQKALGTDLQSGTETAPNIHSLSSKQEDDVIIFNEGDDALTEQEATSVQNQDTLILENSGEANSQQNEEKPFIEILAPTPLTTEERKPTQETFSSGDESLTPSSEVFFSHENLTESTTGDLTHSDAQKSSVISPSDVGIDSSLLQGEKQALTEPSITVDKQVETDNVIAVPQSTDAAQETDSSSAQQTFFPKEEMSTDSAPANFTPAELSIPTDSIYEKPQSTMQSEIKASLEAPTVEQEKPAIPVLSIEKSSSATLPTLSTLEKKVVKETALVDNQLQKKDSPQPNSSHIMIDIKQVFAGSPTIYSLLFLLSISMIALCLYHLFTLRLSEIIPSKKIEELRRRILAKDYNGAMLLCNQERSFFFKIIGSGLMAKEQGAASISPIMKAEAKRLTLSFWQRIHFLNDIAIIAPMLGLLGTVLGMFYAFYDINRTTESVVSLFDGLGVSVGTTVAGIFVAIFAMIFHSLSKYKLVRVLATAENTSEDFAQIIENKTSNSQPRAADEFHT